MKSFLLFCLSCFMAQTASSQSFVINFFDPDIYPQGIVYYPAKKVFIVSSMRKGQIGTVTETGKYSMILKDSSLISTAGLKIRNNDLYALAGDIGVSQSSSEATKFNIARLVKINLLENKITGVMSLDSLFPGRHFASDLALDDKGNIYITDSYSPVIYKVDSAGKAAVMLSSDLFNKENAGLKGIAFHKNGYLLVSLHSGDLYKIDLNNNNTITQVNVEGNFAGANSLLFTPNHLLVMGQSGGKNNVYILSSNNSWKSARIIGMDAWKYSYPNNAEFVNNKIYVLDSNLENLKGGSSAPANFSIRVIDLKKRAALKKRRGDKVTVGPIERKKL